MADQRYYDALFGKTSSSSNGRSGNSPSGSSGNNGRSGNSYLRQEWQRKTGQGNGYTPQTSSTSPSRTSPLEDYYNEQIQKKQAIEKARDIIDDRGRGNRSYARNEYLKKSGGVKSTTVDSRGNNSALRKEYQRQNPNIPTMSTSLSDDEKFQLQSAYADAANKYKDASKKAQSIRPEEGLDFASTVERYRSAQQAATEEKAAAESEMDRLRKQLEFYNVEIPDLNQNVFERVWGSAKGGSKQAAGSLGGAVGYTGRVATGSQNAVDKALRASGNEELSALYDVGTEEENAKAMQMQQAIADKSAALSESGGRDIERSKWGASGVGRFALDAVSQVPALAADTAANLIAPGAGMAMMMGRSFGGGVQEAEASGANLAQAGAYGAASAAVESLTEKLTGGLDIAYGKGFTDKVTEKLIGKLAKTDIGRTAFRALTGALGEGAEEFISSAVNPTIRAIYNGKSIGENYSEEQVSDWLYDGLVGAALGLAGSGVSIATGENAKKNAELRSGSIDNAIELMTGKKTASEAQSVTEAQGNITTPPTPSNDAVARPEKLNSTIYNNVETQTTDAQKNTVPNGTENTRISDADLQDYLAVGERQHVRNAKEAQLNNGSSPILTTISQIRSFIRSAMYGEQPNTIKAYGKVGSKMAQDISTASDGKTNVSGYYLELDSNRIRHMKDHVDTDSDGRNIPLTSEQAEQITDYIDNYDNVLDVLTRKDGSTKVYLSKATDDGHVVVVELVSKGRQSLQPVTAWQNTNEAFESIWGKKRADSASQTGQESGSRGYQPALTETSSRPELPQTKSGFTGDASAEAPASDTSIPTAQQNVNSGQAENFGRPFEPTYNRNAAEPQREKLSQFWENTLQKSEAAAGTPEEVSQPLSYLPKTEKQSLAEAASRLSADRQGAIEKLINSEAWSGVQTDTAWQVASDLYSEAAKTGNYEAYTSWRKVMDLHVIDTARGLQAQSKYTRHSGENALDSISAAIADSKLTEAQKKALIDKVGKYATRFDYITRGMSDTLNAETTKTGKPSTELVSLIEEMARERKTWTFKDNVYSDLLNKQNDTYLKEYAYRQLIAMGNDSLSTVSTADKVKAAQSMAQLSSIATFARNIGGNVTFGAVDTLTQNGFGVALDKLISKATGKRTVAVDKGWFSSEARKGSVDAMQKSILEVAGDVDMGGENRYGQSSGRAYKMTGSPVERFMSRWQQLMGYSLTTSDKFSRGGIEAEQMRGLKALKDSGLTDAEIQQLASTMADYRLFQNQGVAATASKATHDFLNLAGFGGKVQGATRKGGFGLGDLVNTYPGVPANLGVKALEYSPVNIAKGGVELINLLKSAKQGKVDVTKQQQAVMDISRGLAGVPAFALFAALTKAGFIRNWDDEDDTDVKAQNAAEGKNGIQVNLDGALRWLKGEENALEWRNGDTLDSIGWLEPINAFMAIGSLMAQEPEDVSAWSYVGDIAEGSIQAFLDIPVVSNLSDMIDTLQYSNAETWTGKAAEAGITYLGNMATGFIPSPVRGVAKATDEYYRDTSGSTPAEAAWNSLIATIPGLRETLPKKLDNFGNEKMYSGNTAERLFNTLINPGDRTTIRQGDASAMLEKLREETGDAGIYPDRKAPKSVEYDDVESMLTPEQKREWQRTSGQLSEKLINDLKQVGTFDRLTPEQQAEVVKTINKLAKDTAKKQFVESTGNDYTSDYDDDRTLTAPAEFYTAKKALSDAKGKKANFDAIDQVLKNFGHLKDDTQTALRDSSGLYVDKLLYAKDSGISSKDWFDTHSAIKEHEKEVGKESQWVSAEAIGSQTKGDDAAKLKALEAQLPPDDDGKRKSIVKRYDAAIDSGISWDDWTEIEKVVNTGAGGWGGTYGIYSGEKKVKKALREAGYTSSQASRIWNVYKKTTDEKYQTARNAGSNSKSSSTVSRAREAYYRALGLIK